MQQIQRVKITDIIPDKNQPRTIFNEQAISELAKSIKTEGVINAIEIDPKYIIITGERRWRAAKVAGLKEIPAKIMKIYPRERFRRQLIENLHTGPGTMTPMEVANALIKMISDIEKRDQDAYVTQLAEEIGKSRKWIHKMVSLTNEPLAIQEYLATPKANVSLLQAVGHAPSSLQKKLKDKIIKQQIIHRDVMRELINASYRNPELTERLLKQDYSKGTQLENILKIQKLSPRFETNLDAVGKGIDIATKLQGLLLAIKGLDVDKITKYDQKQIQKLIEILVPTVNQVHLRITEANRQLTSGKK